MSNAGNLLVCLGDQLDAESSLLRGGDPARDVIWMAEVDEESTHVWSHKARIVLFLSGMRHFREWLTAEGWDVRYLELGEHAHPDLGHALCAALQVQAPARVRVVQPGDYRVEQQLREACSQAGVPLDVLEDDHFFDTLDGFRGWARGRRQLRLEYYYRALRRRYGILMDDGEPVGGQWNFDQDNRQSFGDAGPGPVPAPRRWSPDAITRNVMALVERRFPDHPGTLDAFDWPVTREQAEEALADFIRERLPGFGPYQDALWEGEPWLYHSRLSAALNLKLLSPRSAVAAAEQAYRTGGASLASAEGFIRQVLGWREYVRGIYWQSMPDYLAGNALDAREELPHFYWTGETDMRCLADAVGQTLRLGYAHHIQRLMVTGLYALLYGVEPTAVHRWYLAVYVDAVEWVEAPNTIGMSQFADNGLMASKPYCATGKYIRRMGNHCAGCRYDVEQRTGDSACPFTTLYWDFLARNRERLRHIPRMAMQLRNLERLDAHTVAAIRAQAEAHRRTMAGDG